MMVKYVEVDRTIEIALLLLEEGEDEQTLAYNAALVAFIKNMENVPTADVAEVRHGHWETIDKGHFFYDWKCSKCGGSGRADYRFCPNCGASMMDEEEDNG